MPNTRVRFWSWPELAGPGCVAVLLDRGPISPAWAESLHGHWPAGTGKTVDAHDRVIEIEQTTPAEMTLSLKRAIEKAIAAADRDVPTG